MPEVSLWPMPAWWCVPTARRRVPSKVMPPRQKTAVSRCRAARRGGDYVHVRCLGFAPACLRVSDPTARLVVVLHELAEVLDEVTVKGRYSGVVQRGDTVRFDIGHFKTGTETTVADVLRRLPGVEVADNG